MDAVHCPVNYVGTGSAAIAYATRTALDVFVGDDSIRFSALIIASAVASADERTAAQVDRAVNMELSSV